jgi:hypothetical protein
MVTCTSCTPSSSSNVQYVTFSTTMSTVGSGQLTTGGAGSDGESACTTRAAMSSPVTLGVPGSTVGSGGLFGESATLKSNS